MKKFISFSVASVICVFASNSALASGGTFDFLDPCIEAHETFQSQQSADLAAYDYDIKNVDIAPAPEKYRQLWMESKKKQMRPIFNEVVAPSLQAAGLVDMDKHFEGWFDEILSVRVGKDNVDALVQTHFREELKRQLVKGKASTEAQYETASKELGSACKMDLGNQTLRVAIVAALAPVSIISNSLEAAKQESGVFNQALRASSGVSIKDIKEHGAGGGENSEVRKAGRAIAKVFGW